MRAVAILLAGLRLDIQRSRVEASDRQDTGNRTKGLWWNHRFGLGDNGEDGVIASLTGMLARSLLGCIAARTPLEEDQAQ